MGSIKAFFDWLISFLPADQWKGAVLGALVSGVFAGAAALTKRAIRTSPRRQLLGSLASPTARPEFYLRSMFSPTNQFQSKEPQVLPTGPMAVQVSTWQNIPSVVGLADLAAASDLAGVLADAGVREPIEFRDLEHDWDRWTESLVSIGGHFKTYRLLQVLLPEVVEYVPNDRFRVLATGEEFIAQNGQDFGLVLKAPHPVTKATCIVVFGLGALGTEAAARFLRTQAPTLGRMFARRSFALIVKVALVDGVEGGRLTWISSTPRWHRWLFHPLACWYGKKLIKS